MALGVEALTDEELREAIRGNDAPRRVYAAFELGKRLGAAVVGELPIRDEGDSGVRRHWLTVLASFGEQEAVMAVAEAQPETPEGEHAITLCAQLGVGSPEWTACQFNLTTNHIRHLLLGQHSDRVLWSAALEGLEQMLTDPRPDLRCAAAQRLLELTSQPTEAMRSYAIEHMLEAPAVLDAWAQGPDFRELFQRSAGLGPDLSQPPSSRVDRAFLAIQALLRARRWLPFSEVAPHLRRRPETADLIERPVPRSGYFSFFHDFISDEYTWYVPEPLLRALRDAVPPPWSEGEQAVIDGWKATVQRQKTPDWWADEFDGPYESPEVLALKWLGLDSDSLENA